MPGTDTPFIDSLVNKTEPTPWHQVIAVSQDMINKAFANMWILADTKSAIKTFNVGTRGNGSINAILEAPKIVLNVAGKKPSDPQVFYNLIFKSGTMRLFSTENPEDETKKSFDIAGWSIVFPVTIARKILDPKSPDYEGYLTKMGQPKGVFSLAQLLIDTSSPAQYDPHQSHMSVDWSKETSVIQDNFSSLIRTWMDKMIIEKKTILGIALQATKPETVNPYAPTFPPTSLDYYAYPWLDPSKASPPKEISDQNAFCYLMMTDRAKPPDDSKLQQSGTWVDSTANHGATLVMNREQFFTQWLLPEMRVLNRAAEITCSKPTAEINWLGVWSAAPRFLTSLNPDHTGVHDDYFNFTRNPDNTYTWKSKKSTCSNSDKGGAYTLDVNEDAQAVSNVTFAKGGQAINFDGTTVFNFNADAGIVAGKSDLHCTLKWKYHLALVAVRDGGLQIQHMPIPPAEAISVEVTGSDKNDGSSVKDQVYGEVTKSFTKYMTAVQDVLTFGLENQHKLYLPASGTFLAADPIFNARGDLLVNLHYNGAPGPDESPSTPEYLKDRPARTPRTHAWEPSQ